MRIASRAVRIRNWCRRAMSRHCARRLVNVEPAVPLISFTFDDFPRSALSGGGTILKQHGLRGTYYVALGLMDREIPAGRGFSAADLVQAADEGHELGCHTFAHCHAWETRPKVFEESIIENKRRLGELLPGYVFGTLSYPIYSPRPATKRRAAKYFSCCRGGDQTFNVGPTDANSLQACFLEKSRDNPDALKRLIKENCLARGWLIFATHDVSPTPSPFGCTPGFFADIVQYAVSSGSRILPVGQAWEARCGPG